MERAGIENLSGPQWYWRPGEGRWSVAECAGQLILAESFLFGLMEDTLKQAANGGSDPSMDAPILSSTADRSRKAESPRRWRSLRGAAMDAYQILLRLSAHTERHTAQIREVKKTSGFPER